VSYNCKKLAPDWTSKCSSCDHSPIVPATGLCGPCTWGEVDTIDDWEYATNEPCQQCTGDCEVNNG
jgi:hypothetical protein